MVLAKDPSKVKLESFRNSRVPELGKLCVPWFVMVLGGFYSNLGLTFIPWLRRCFLVEEILFNSHILWNPFLVGLPLIRVNHGEQDIFLYNHAWRSSKATSNSSKIGFFPSAFFCQLLIPSTYSSHLV